MRGSHRAAVAACLGAAAFAAALGAAAPAHAGGRGERDVCARVVAVRDSPGGFAVGYLRRPETVRVTGRDETRRWARIRTRARLQGWIPARALC